MRFTIFGMMLMTAIVAVALAIEGAEPLVFWGIIGLCLSAISSALPAGLRKLRLWLAKLLAVRFYDSWLFLPLRWICGRSNCSAVITNHAHELSAREIHNLALPFYAKVADVWPSNAIVLINLGASLYCCARIEDAIENLTKGLTISPRNKQGLVYRGFAKFAVGDTVGALEDLRKVKFNEAIDVGGAVFRGKIYETVGNWDAAIADYQLAMELDESDSAATLQYARLLSGCPDERLRNGEKAVELANKVCMRTNWEDWLSLSILAAAFAETGNFSRALECAEKCLELAPEEEKAERAKRIDQYKRQEPFRIVASVSYAGELLLGESSP